jgi:hypothetical protein
MTMSLPFAVVTFVAYLAALARVLVYRRNGARHRPHVSWVAWALAAVTGGASIELVTHAGQVGFFQMAAAVLLAAFVFGARGNVARLLRSE